jgi:hypothetical protein
MVQQESKQEKECGLFREPTPKCTTYRFSASSPSAIDTNRIERESLTRESPVAIVWESGRFMVLVHESIWLKVYDHKESTAYTKFLRDNMEIWHEPRPGLLSWILKRIKEIKYGPYRDQRKVNVKVNVVRI